MDADIFGDYNSSSCTSTDELKIKFTENCYEKNVSNFCSAFYIFFIRNQCTVNQSSFENEKGNSLQILNSLHGKCKNKLPKNILSIQALFSNHHNKILNTATPKISDPVTAKILGPVTAKVSDPVTPKTLDTVSPKFQTMDV